MTEPRRPISKGRWALALLFIGAGTMHFVAPAPYIRIMPPALPHPSALVAVSGAAEILGGLGLLISAMKRLAAISLAVLLVAVFPANWTMLGAHMSIGGWAIPQWMLWVRLPLQLPLIWWTLKYAHARPSRSA